MPRKAKKRQRPQKRRTSRFGVEQALRIIGGTFRGRMLAYHGDRCTRPMKDRTREAVFDLLGPTVKGKHAIDLFAGTGAMGLEAISRGAVRATLVERHVPTAKVIEENICLLNLEAQTHLVVSDTFFWVQHGSAPDDHPWIVFCCPPYELYVDRRDDMLRLIQTILKASPTDSTIVVEADAGFDFALLPQPAQWDLRRYEPAFIALYWKEPNGR